jgi:uncharacterized protein (DUF1330 family)
MPKGYIVSRVDVKNPAAYAKYIEAGSKAMATYGGKPLARGGRFEELEGQARARNVVIEFESFEAAQRYYYSPEYQEAKAFREGAADMEIVLVEGV